MEKYKVDGWNNLCRVYEVPDTYPDKFCFGGGFTVEFKMVDWFKPVAGVANPAVSKDTWEQKVGPIDVKKVTLEELSDYLVPFLLGKRYLRPSKTYIAICDFGASFVFNMGGCLNE